MDTIKHAGKYILEKTRAVEKGVEERVHKNTVKDSAAPVSKRTCAAFEVVGDKIEKKGHDAKAEYHKQLFKH
ncbi:predicted protein [Sclerotinia sclerotiorum 1980 UF-70]|uniref:Uncharacterized protein n=1 Tax=Sclerotinia sclerotiorum (strain ATCC 18683 / 1980 / Ss-1) TaxID=665079 RepID=A7EPI8_SCLS1|nr:predicted protein [Sclerotinia sclerotiorum 1980 UF-70]EDO04754.1 predicted protein [Sclerotinia sclerotiorum 1980 UF-70]